MMSALWHGPTVGYVGGALIVITALNINKQWYKLRTTKKKLRFAEILIETKICNFFSWMLTAITVFAIVVMLTDQNIDTITSKYARVYFWPLWGIPLTSLGLSALNKILIWFFLKILLILLFSKVVCIMLSFFFLFWMNLKSPDNRIGAVKLGRKISKLPRNKYKIYHEKCFFLS